MKRKGRNKGKMHHAGIPTVLWLVLTLVAPGWGAQKITPEPTTTAPIILGYYPSWKSGVEPSQIHFSQFTHLCHAFVTADTSGTLKTEGNLPSRDLTTLAHARGVKVLLSLGGMDSGNYFGPMIKDQAATERFISGVAQMVIDYGYDGVDLDWEFPRNEQEKAGFTQMARRLREIFNEKHPGALITSALSGTPWASKWIDEKALLPLLDLVCVMTYDQHGPWSSHAGYNSALYWDSRDTTACRNNSVVGQLAFWTDTKQWPKERLLVGLACYGRSFAVEQWYAPIKYSDKTTYPYLPYKEVAGLLKEGWVRSWDPTAMVPYLSKQGVKELITYDDEQSIAHKARWAAQQGYRGIFFWEISQDYVNGEHRLVKSAHNAMKEADAQKPR